MKWLFEGIDANDFPFTKEEWDCAVQECVQMGLLDQVGVNEFDEPLYVLSEHGKEYATSSVISHIAYINKFE